jgi:hypothetical protein
MASEKENLFPSTAHYENGVYVHDPLNQSLAEAEAQGKLGAHNIGQREHPFPKPDLNG